MIATVFAAALSFARGAHAEPASDHEQKDQDGPERDHELTIVPIVGGSSDVGIGGGYIASYARLAPGAKPYVWHIESSGSATAKFGDPVRLGYFDENLSFAMPDAFIPRLRIELKANYTVEPRLYYYGIGNASTLAGRDPSDDYYAFERWHGTVSATMRYVFPARWLVLSGLGYTHSVIHYGDDTALARDAASGDPAVERVLHPHPRENVATFGLGVGLDTRDDEV
ncbi:MAG TPA: hypothetical protein VGQ57_05365, partial [Polyangiaceae bacterium]|nr:hypothetical protein [Polyangiaceae bacterium]